MEDFICVGCCPVLPAMRSLCWKRINSIFNRDCKGCRPERTEQDQREWSLKMSARWREMYLDLRAKGKLNKHVPMLSAHRYFLTCFTVVPPLDLFAEHNLQSTFLWYSLIVNHELRHYRCHFLSSLARQHTLGIHHVVLWTYVGIGAFLWLRVINRQFKLCFLLWLFLFIYL